jgi:hypothetical protein
VQLAKQRLKLEGAAKRDPELQPGGRFDGRPVDWALSKYVFFECSKCQLPYFGGARECGAAAAAEAVGGAPGVCLYVRLLSAPICCVCTACRAKQLVGCSTGML